MGAPIPKIQKWPKLATWDWLEQSSISWVGQGTPKPLAAATPEGTTYPCEYCKSEVTADEKGNCFGCGHPKPTKRRIEVTTLTDKKRRYIWGS